MAPRGRVSDGSQLTTRHHVARKRTVKDSFGTTHLSQSVAQDPVRPRDEQPALPGNSSQSEGNNPLHGKLQRANLEARILCSVSLVAIFFRPLEADTVALACVSKVLSELAHGHRHFETGLGFPEEDPSGQWTSCVTRNSCPLFPKHPASRGSKTSQFMRILYGKLKCVTSSRHLPRRLRQSQRRTPALTVT